MIVYQATKASFIQDVFDDVIETKVLEHFQKNLKRKTTASEISSWKDSMQYMERVVRHPEIPEDCGVAIEYQLPQSGKRVDFILTGMGTDNQEYCIIVELKRWSTAEITAKDAVVRTQVGKSVSEHTHPSYQAWSYASLLKNFNQTVYHEKIELRPCAYLHNYLPDEVIKNEHYREHIDKAPVFLRGDASKLQAFILKYVRKGDQNKLLFRIDQGEIRPSKMLADSLSSMLARNEEFVMIDEQKLVYEAALELSKNARPKNKQVLIVQGGPGTGKSVVAINLLVELTQRGKLTQYISKNAAPRAVYASKLAGTIKKTEISNLFAGSGGFTSNATDVFHALIVDEAHRLNEKSGLYRNLGENQVKEIIQASQLSIFFIDENQRVTLNDIGTKEEIQKWSSMIGAEVTEMELSSQFRCNGSDGYLAWIDWVLQIRETENRTLDGISYDFQVFDSSTEMRKAIEIKNQINNKSRMVAGYCWEWKSKKQPDTMDVVLEDGSFQMKWNLASDGSLWIIGENSINEIGCIHTCQGLEMDYVGVIIGDDLVFRDGQVQANPQARAKSDSSIRGWKKLLEKEGATGYALLASIIKNTYRTLMTRGMKGCYVYCTDEALREYIKSCM